MNLIKIVVVVFFFGFATHANSQQINYNFNGKLFEFNPKNVNHSYNAVGSMGAFTLSFKVWNERDNYCAVQIIVNSDTMGSFPVSRIAQGIYQKTGSEYGTASIMVSFPNNGGHKTIATYYPADMQSSKGNVLIKSRNGKIVSGDFNATINGYTIKGEFKDISVSGWK